MSRRTAGGNRHETSQLDPQNVHRRGGRRRSCRRLVATARCSVWSRMLATSAGRAALYCARRLAARSARHAGRFGQARTARARAVRSRWRHGRAAVRCSTGRFQERRRSRTACPCPSSHIGGALTANTATAATAEALGISTSVRRIGERVLGEPRRPSHEGRRPEPRAARSARGATEPRGPGASRARDHLRLSQSRGRVHTGGRQGAVRPSHGQYRPGSRQDRARSRLVGRRGRRP